MPSSLSRAVPNGKIASSSGRREFAGVCVHRGRLLFIGPPVSRWRFRRFPVLAVVNDAARHGGVYKCI